MSKTIRELADEFGVSKQAIRKRLDANFRANYVQTVSRNGVQTLVVSNSGYLLLKKHFNSSNNQELGKEMFTSNTRNNSIDTIDFLKEQLSIKDNQLKTMQKLLDQSQQLQLIAEKKIEELKTITSKQNAPNNNSGSKSDSNNDSNGKKNVWWHFW